MTTTTSMHKNNIESNHATSSTSNNSVDATISPSPLSSASIASNQSSLSSPEQRSSQTSPPRSKSSKSLTSSSSPSPPPSASSLASHWQPIRGTHDRLPLEHRQQRWFESVCGRVARSFSYLELSTPILERSDLFRRSIAESDAGGKEMFSFDDHGVSTCLRPESTVAVARALLGAGRISASSKLQRYWYCGAMFRRERPQAGRYRQFTQFGVEFVGSESAHADGEVIQIAHECLKQMGIAPYVQLEINSLGSISSRASFKLALGSFLLQHRARLSTDGQARLDRGALMQILDSKDLADRDVIRGSEGFPPAPLLADHLSPDDSERFRQLQSTLDDARVPYEINPFLVRGLDYYAHGCFEFVLSPSAIRARLRALGDVKDLIPLPSQATILAGGRYDGLYATLGGPANVPAVGWAAGMERIRLLALLVNPQREMEHQESIPIGVIMIEDDGKGKDQTKNAVEPSTLSSSPSLSASCSALCTFIRRGCRLHIDDSSSSSSSSSAPPYSVVRSFHPSMSKQLKYCTKPDPSLDTSRTVSVVVIVGSDELAQEQVKWKQLSTGKQGTIKIGRLAHMLKALTRGEGEGGDETAEEEESDAIITYAMLRDAV